MLKRQPSGIPEVQEDLEDEQSEDYDNSQAIEKKLTSDNANLGDSVDKPRVHTTAIPKLINIRD